MDYLDGKYSCPVTNELRHGLTEGPRFQTAYDVDHDKVEQKELIQRAQPCHIIQLHQEEQGLPEHYQAS